MSDSIVIHGDVDHAGMLSDMLTTVVFIMGPEKGISFIQQMDGVDGEITMEDGTIYETPEFMDHFQI